MWLWMSANLTFHELCISVSHSVCDRFIGFVVMDVTFSNSTTIKLNHPHNGNKRLRFTTLVLCCTSGFRWIFVYIVTDKVFQRSRCTSTGWVRHRTLGTRELPGDVIMYCVFMICFIRCGHLLRNVCEKNRLTKYHKQSESHSEDEPNFPCWVGYPESHVSAFCNGSRFEQSFWDHIEEISAIPHLSTRGTN